MPRALLGRSSDRTNRQPVVAVVVVRVATPMSVRAFFHASETSPPNAAFAHIAAITAANRKMICFFMVGSIT